MDARTEGGLMPPAFRTEVLRVSDLELRVTRSFDAPARLVYKAWTTPALFMRWWAPKSIGMSILSCDMDVRTGGGYRLAFGRSFSRDIGCCIFRWHLAHGFRFAIAQYDRFSAHVRRAFRCGFARLGAFVHVSDVNLLFSHLRRGLLVKRLAVFVLF